MCIDSGVRQRWFWRHTCPQLQECLGGSLFRGPLIISIHVRICICIYHIYMYIYIYIYTHICICIYTHVFVYIYIHTYYAYVYMYRKCCIHTCHLYNNLNDNLSLYIYIYIYIWCLACVLVMLRPRIWAGRSDAPQPIFIHIHQLFRILYSLV